MIRRKIITQEDAQHLNVDRLSCGIGFMLGDAEGFPDKLLQKEEIESDTLEFPDEDDRYKLKLYKQPGGMYLADWYESLNGNIIACDDYLAAKYPALDVSSRRSIEGKSNLVSIRIRNKITDLDQVFIDEVPRIICEKLYKVQSEIFDRLVRRFGDELVKPQPYFRIQSFEANLDVPSPVGDDYGRNTLVATLLSQHALRSAFGYYLNDLGYVVALPNNQLLDTKRVCQSNLACGIPCVWMQFDNGLEMVVYLKEMSRCADITSPDHQYLQRFEIRVTRSFRIQNASELVKDVLGDNQFSSPEDLRALLLPFYKKIHAFLFDVLNVPFDYNDEDNIERIATMIEEACPIYSRWLVRRLMKDSGRVYVSEAKERGINDQLKEISKGTNPLIAKPRGPNGRYYVLNWLAVPLSKLTPKSKVLRDRKFI